MHMHWWILPVAVTWPCLGIACSDSAPEPPPKKVEAQTPAQANTFVLTYFNIPR